MESTYQATRSTQVGGLKRARRVALLSAIAGAFMFAGELAADSMRCGHKVVRTGDSPAALLERCGEPRYRSRGDAEIDTAQGRRSVKVQRWHYKEDERSLERVVLVFQGEIVGMETGRR